jgi:hypothetical protein
MMFTGKWVELEIILLSEVIQVHKDKVCMFSLIYVLEVSLRY